MPTAVTTTPTAASSTTVQCSLYSGSLLGRISLEQYNACYAAAGCTFDRQTNVCKGNTPSATTTRKASTVPSTTTVPSNGSDSGESLSSFLAIRNHYLLSPSLMQEAPCSMCGDVWP